MRWGLRAITALSALAYAVGAACGGGGSDKVFITSTEPAFPQGFLPVLLPAAGGSGDVAFRASGDLYAVAGTADVTVVARSDGEVSTFAENVGGASNPALLSIVVGPDGRIFAGDDVGRIWAIAADGASSSLLVDTATGDPITGLAFAPTGFGEFAGSLFAAAGASGIHRIITGDLPTTSPFANPSTGGSYVDVAFSGTTLFALDEALDKLDTVSSDGTAASFQASGFVDPVGLAVDDGRSEILVADAGDDVLLALPVSGGAPSDRAPYDFDPDAPSGIAYDGLGAIAFVASGAIRGSAVPRIDPANPNFGLIFIGPTVGYGDLELDRNGAFVLVANDEGTPNNFLFRVSRDGSTATALASGIGAAAAGEALLSLAIDPAEETIFIGTSLGNVYRRISDGTVSLLVSATAAAVLGLELAPDGFDGFGGHLIATTSDGEMLAIDPLSPAPVVEITLSESVSRISDLVFASDGILYVLDHDPVNDPPTSRILIVAPDGDVTDLGVDPAELGRPDGIEIDEGGQRLLVTSAFAGGEKLLAVALVDSAVTPLANVDIDDGFFPTGVVYDRLGTAILRQGDGFTALDAVSVFP